MHTIWKFPVSLHGPTEMPKGARILSAGEQDQTIFVWAIVDAKAQIEYRPIHVYGTGHPIDSDPGEFLGTVQMENGLVFHLFDNSDDPRKGFPTRRGG